MITQAKAMRRIIVRRRSAISKQITDFFPVSTRAYLCIFLWDIPFTRILSLWVERLCCISIWLICSFHLVLLFIAGFSGMQESYSDEQTAPDAQVEKNIDWRRRQSSLLRFLFLRSIHIEWLHRSSPFSTLWPKIVPSSAMNQVDLLKDDTSAAVEE